MVNHRKGESSLDVLTPGDLSIARVLWVVQKIHRTIVLKQRFGLIDIRPSYFVLFQDRFAFVSVFHPYRMTKLDPVIIKHWTE